MGELSGRESGRVRRLSAIAGRGLGSPVNVSSGRVGLRSMQEKWPVDDSGSELSPIRYRLQCSRACSEPSPSAFSIWPNHNSSHISTHKHVLKMEAMDSWFMNILYSNRLETCTGRRGPARPGPARCPQHPARPGPARWYDLIFSPGPARPAKIQARPGPCTL